MTQVDHDDATPVLEFFEDPQDFLRAAGEFLRSAPVLCTVVATVTQRCLAGGVGDSPFPRWWVTVHEHGQVVGVAMRTAPGAPSPPYVTDLSAAAAAALARALVERGEEITAVNGAVSAAWGVAEETARLRGGSVQVVEHTRLHALERPERLVPPRSVPGHLRVATRDDVGVCLQWWEDFEVDAAAQAGRADAKGPLEPQDERLMLTRIEQRTIWLWEDDDGAVVHLTGCNHPAFGVVRIGPVFTPPEQRGRGYAAAAVAEVSASALAAGHRVCLFTDQANPVSNRLYAGLGYEPVVDAVQLAITTPAPA